MQVELIAQPLPDTHTVHVIKTDEEAIQIAQRFADQIRSDSGDRDKYRRLPVDEIDLFSRSGLWGITVPKQYGGAQVSTRTFAEVIAIVSEADASIGQIPQNHFANIEEIRLVGTESQKAFFFERILKGDRLGNLVYRKTAQNFNPTMATAAKITIAEVEELVERITPEEFMTPGIYVKRIIQGASYEKRIERRTLRGGG